MHFFLHLKCHWLLIYHSRTCFHKTLYWKMKHIWFLIHAYLLCTAYCRKTMKKGGACIFTQNGLICSKIDLKKYCSDQDIEICMINLQTTYTRLHIMVVYRAPTGDFNLFLNRLDDSIKSIYKTKSNLMICGDINTDYLSENNRKKNSIQCCKHTI